MANVGFDSSAGGGQALMVEQEMVVVGLGTIQLSHGAPEKPMSPVVSLVPPGGLEIHYRR